MAKESETSFTTAGDLEASWRALDATETARAETLLLQASNYLRQIAFNNGKNLDDLIAADNSGVYKANVKKVITDAVQRSMTAPTEIMPDASQWSQSASPYSESMSLSAEVSTTIYFKVKELKLLGLPSIAGNPSVALLRGVR